MRTLRHGHVALVLAALATACGSSDTNPEKTCGPNGECPTGFTCDPGSNTCISSSGGGVDAAVTGADAAVEPETTLTKSPPARTSSTAATFEFTGTPVGVTFECSLDDAAFAACTSPAMYTVEEGDHTFKVVAVLGAQRDPSPETASWTVDTTAPTVTIDSGPGAVAGSSVTFTYSSEPGATFECALDTTGTADFTSCPAEGISYDNLVDGTSYNFRVRAVDDVGNAGSPAGRIFKVDAAVPVLTAALDTADASTGTATFTLTTSEPLASYDARLDGTPCEVNQGFTLATCLFVAPGAHTFEVSGSDAAGNMSSVATATATMSYGPGLGHLVLLGHGFRSTNATETQILGNALALAPVTALAEFDRPLRLLFYDGGLVDATEKTNVLAAIVAGLAQHGLTYDPATSEEFGSEPGDDSRLAERLAGKDALVIYDQGAATDLSTVAVAFKAPLEDFLDAGGIVVVTDGWYGAASKTPSRSYQIIDPTLLGVDSAELQTGAIDLNPIMDSGTIDLDPLASDVASGYTVGSTDPANGYAITDQFLPVYCPSGDCTEATVVDKVFPRPLRGPIEITLAGTQTASFKATVVFQHPDGTVDHGPIVDASGTVQGSVDEGGMVTIAFQTQGGDLPTYVLETMMGLKPFDKVTMGANIVDMGGGNNPPPLGTVNIALPDHSLATYMGSAAVLYDARVLCTTSGTAERVDSLQSCGQNWSSNNLCTTPDDAGFWTLSYYSDCVDESGNINVVLSAVDKVGNVIGLQLLRDIDPKGGDPAATAESWTTAVGPDFTLMVSDPPAGTMSVATSGFFRLGPYTRGDQGYELPVPFPAPTQSVLMVSPDNADAMGDIELVAFAPGSGSLVIHANYSVLQTSRSVDLAQELLSRVSFTQSGTAARPAVTIDAPVPDAPGASATFWWQSLNGNGDPVADHFWGLIFAPSADTITAPVVPASLASYAPGQPSTSAPTFAAGIVLDSTLYADYDEFRGQYFFPTVLSIDETRELTFRATAQEGIQGAISIYLPFFN